MLFRGLLSALPMAVAPMFLPLVIPNGLDAAVAVDAKCFFSVESIVVDTYCL